MLQIHTLRYSAFPGWQTIWINPHLVLTQYTLLNIFNIQFNTLTVTIGNEHNGKQIMSSCIIRVALQ
jgi:hypothetical protein